MGYLTWDERLSVLPLPLKAMKGTYLKDMKGTVLVPATRSG